LILTAQQILEHHRYRTEVVSIGEGQEVIVRTLPAHVVDGSRDKEVKNSDAYVFVHAVVDENGKRLFADEQVDEVAETISSDVLMLVASKAFAMSVVSDARKLEIKKNWQILGIDPFGESASPKVDSIPT
jgi:hypothetical protein